MKIDNFFFEMAKGKKINKKERLNNYEKETKQKFLVFSLQRKTNTVLKAQHLD